MCTGHIHILERVIENEAVDIDFDVVDGEERWTSIGHTDQVRILIVAWTMKADSMRPVTAYEPRKRLAKEYVKSRQ